MPAFAAGSQRLFRNTSAELKAVLLTCPILVEPPGEEVSLLLPGASAESAAMWRSRCVGQRGAIDDPPWVEFIHERRTRFEFETSEAVDAHLLGPLGKAGWHTFDTN